MVKTILVLASNPKGTSALALDQEKKRIRNSLKKAKQRQNFDLEIREAVTPQDLQLALLEVRPQIVHFCGHGEGIKGLIFENDEGRQHPVSTDALTNLFGLVNDFVECVVLNACYSEEQAQAIANHINYVIGMREDILDDAAIAFTEGFYNALGAGESIELAYQYGCNLIQMLIDHSSDPRKAEPVEPLEPVDLPEHLVPVLLNNNNSKPSLLPEKALNSPINNPKKIQKIVGILAGFLAMTGVIYLLPNRLKLPTNPKITLKSERDINYQTLEKLLEEQQFKAADEETARIMFSIAPPQSQYPNQLDPQKIINFPCLDLLTIDQLWQHYSNSKFSFSKQSEIWKSVGGNFDVALPVYDNFNRQVDWGKNKTLLSLNYSMNASAGHLPSVVGRVYNGTVWAGELDEFAYLTQRLNECRNES